MSRKAHEQRKRQHHEHGHDHPQGESHERPRGRWKLWLAVGVMLVAMLAYVLSMDEELQPGGADGEQSMPIADEAPP